MAIVFALDDDRATRDAQVAVLANTSLRSTKDL